MNLYEYINSFNSKAIFLYLFIFVVLLYFFKGTNIGINIILALAVGFGIVIYLNSGQQSSADNLKNQMDLKYRHIRPQPTNVKNYPELIDFIFSIQDFYVMNPQAYEEMIDSIDSFMSLYQDSLIEPKLANQSFNMADTKKHNALNSLQSIIFNMPTDKNVTNKLKVAIRTLEKILNNYLEKMYHASQESLYKNGFDNRYNTIDFGPKPHNFYLKTKYTYDIY